jgi:CTP:molybdopterin cytidylyltransferase MocA
LGGLKGIPASSKVRAFLRQSESQNDIEIGRKIAFDVLASDRIQSVIIGTLDPEKPVNETIGRSAGIVLAAGSSTRLEGPKQLLDFKRKPLVSYAIESAQMAGLAPIVLVVGDHEDAIRQAVEAYDIKIVRNPNPDLGQSSSLQIGLNGISSNVEAVIFLLADMPLISAELIIEMILRHRKGLSPIIVPYAGGRRGNPVLFDRITFEKLLQIKGDRGGRDIFSAFTHEQLEWDDSIHFDVDTPEDLDKLRGLE